MLSVPTHTELESERVNLVEERHQQVGLRSKQEKPITRIKNSGWSIPADHPDLAPAASAGFISETLRNLQSNTPWRNFGLELADAKAAVTTAAALEKALSLDSSNSEVLNMQFDLVRQSCTLCHAKLRKFRCTAEDPS